jgi:hypothetical protein
MSSKPPSSTPSCGPLTTIPEAQALEASEAMCRQLSWATLPREAGNSAPSPGMLDPAAAPHSNANDGHRWSADQRLRHPQTLCRALFGVVGRSCTSSARRVAARRRSRSQSQVDRIGRSGTCSAGNMGRCLACRRRGGDRGRVIVAGCRHDATIGRTIDVIGAGTGEGAPIAAAIRAPSWQRGQPEVAARLGSTQPGRGK